MNGGTIFVGAAAVFAGAFAAALVVVTRDWNRRNKR